MLGSGEHYALEVRGDSMVDAGILDGDMALIQRNETADTGDIVVALIDDEEATLKRFRRRGASIALEPANASYEVRILPPNRVKIQGKLIGLYRNIDCRAHLWRGAIDAGRTGTTRARLRLHVAGLHRLLDFAGKLIEVPVKSSIHFALALVGGKPAGQCRLGGIVTKFFDRGQMVLHCRSGRTSATLATRISASIAACHSGVTCSAFGSLVM